MGHLITNASKHNIVVHERYSNRLEHTNFYIMETNSLEDIDALFDPVLELGSWEITPVIKKNQLVIIDTISCQETFPQISGLKE